MTTRKNKEKAVISTRLTTDEIRFLKNLGNGDLSAGIRISLERAGYEGTEPATKGYRVIRENANQGEENGFRYTLYLNGEKVGPSLNVSNSISKALTERFGENHAMQELIIKSFIKLPKEVEINKIYNLAGRAVWDIYSS